MTRTHALKKIRQIKFHLHQRHLQIQIVKSSQISQMIRAEALTKIYQIYNPGQNIWHKIEKSSKTGQEKKSLTSNFACLLTTIAKV